jgi:predicted RNase H-like HicB family nuclease
VDIRAVLTREEYAQHCYVGYTGRESGQNRRDGSCVWVARRIPAMLTKYIQAALRHAAYEILPDDRSFYGEIPVCNGVYANAATLGDCRDQLVEALEEWILFRVHKNLPLPVIDGIELAVKEVSACQP